MSTKARSGKYDIFTKIALLLVILIVGFLIVLPLLNIFVYSSQPSGSAIVTGAFSDLVTRNI
ncbi:MAG: hypothetical protein RLZZ317_991, partial [Actinomycetota bacterium]